MSARPTKLKCKPGYIQRGAACQPIGEKKQKSASNKSKKGIASAVVGAALVGAGVAAIARRKPQQPSVTPSQPVDEKPASKINAKHVAAAGVLGGIVAGGTVAALHPRAKEAIAQQVSFRQADAIGLVGDFKSFTQTPEEKAAAETIRKEIREKYPAKSADGNYDVDTDSAKVAKDLEDIFQKNREALATTKEPRKRQKLLQQNQLIRYSLAMNKLSNSSHPHLVLAGFRDKEGNLVGASAGVPDPQYRALYFGGFFVKDGTDRNAAKEILKTNQQISQNMGYEGRLTGEPHKSAQPLYKRYGGRPVPGDDTTWIFDGKDRAKEGWYNKHESLKAIADVIDVDGYGEKGKEGITQHVDDLALIPKEAMVELKRRGLREIEIKNKPINEMNNLSRTKDQVPPGYTPGATMEKTCAGTYVFNEKTLCLRGDLQSGSTSTALHEMGHAVAHLMQYDKDKRLKALHKKVYNDLNPYQQQDKPGGFSGCHEMFAESFALYIKAPRVARRTLHPDIYDYMKNVVMADFEKLKGKDAQTKRDSGDRLNLTSINIGKLTVYQLKNGNYIVPKAFFYDTKTEAGEVIGDGLDEVKPGTPEGDRWKQFISSNA